MEKILEIAGDGAPMPRFDDGMVNMAESPVNEIMDVRADEACESGNRRNGYSERELVTSAGTIDLRIPKPRASSYPPPRTSSSGARAWSALSSPRCPRWRPTACPPGR